MKSVKLLVELDEETHEALKELAWMKRTSLRKMLPGYLKAMGKVEAKRLGVEWPVKRGAAPRMLLDGLGG